MFEADDVIASVAANTKSKVLIHSEDRDHHQILVDGRVTILKKFNTPDPRKPVQTKYFSHQDLVNEYGFGSGYWATFQAIVGQKDAIPGWDHVGEKTAKEICSRGLPLNIDALQEHLALKSNQVESWEAFREYLPEILCCRRLNCSLQVPEGVIDAT